MSLAKNFLFWVTFAALCFLLMTSAACPDNEVMCLADPGHDARAVVGDESEEQEPRASGAWSGSSSVPTSALSSATARSLRK